MRRISVIGCSGGGKSTLARALAEKLGLPLVHLDTLFWRPGWVPGEPEAFRRRVAEAVGQEAWIIDGGFIDTSELRLPRSELIVWVDQPRSVCLRRAIQRVVTSFGRVRPDLAPGCPEKFDVEFLRYIWDWDRDTRPRSRRRFGSSGRARGSSA